MPEPRSISELPSTSTRTPPPGGGRRRPAASCRRRRRRAASCARAAPASRARDLGDEAALLGEGGAAGPGRDSGFGHAQSLWPSVPVVQGRRERRFPRWPYDGLTPRPRTRDPVRMREDGPREQATRRRRPRLHRLDRHPGPGPGARQPRPVPGRGADRRRQQPRAVRAAGRRVRARRSTGWARTPASRPPAAPCDVVLNGITGAVGPAPDPGRARRRQHARAGQQGVADHGRPAGPRARRAGPDRARSTPSTPRSPSACAAARPTRYAVWC